jgi:hypothetical protein
MITLARGGMTRLAISWQASQVRIISMEMFEIDANLELIEIVLLDDEMQSGGFVFD